MAEEIRLQLRRGTAAQWAAENPVLDEGEHGYVINVDSQGNKTDITLFKIGDGTTPWNTLGYFNHDYRYYTKAELGIEEHTKVTYAELRQKMNSATLLPGRFYQITDFQTIHIIQETNNLHLNVNGTVYAPASINYPESVPKENWTNTNSEGVENLVVLAITPSVLSPTAYSREYPNDVIQYDVYNDRCEDRVVTNGVVINPGTPRKGKIEYRKDTIHNNEVYYDFRKVKFIRYKLNPQMYNSTVRYAVRAIVRNGNNLFRCVKLTATSATPTPTTSVTEYWIQVWRFRPEFVCNYVGVKGGATNYLGPLNVPTDPALFRYYLTFNSIVEGNGVETAQEYYTLTDVNNNHIGPWHGGLHGARGSYNNIVFIMFPGKPLSGNIIHPNGRYMTFCYNFSNNIIGHDCTDLVGGQQFIENVIGPFMQRNITMLFEQNIVESNVIDNIFSGGTSINTFGHYMTKCILAGGFNNNRLLGRTTALYTWNVFINNTFVTSSSDNKIYGRWNAVAVNQWFANNIIHADYGDLMINVYIMNKTLSTKHDIHPIDLRSPDDNVYYSSVNNRGELITTKVT